MVKLELIEFADFTHPEEIVAEIFRQNPRMDLPIPLDEIAKAAGIVEIRNQPLESLEGGLVANAEKTEGAILINSRSLPLQRQRFTLGHELGHFMLPRHNHFMECVASDMSHHKGLTTIEVEANAFAAALLMPQHCFMMHPSYPEIPSCKALLSLANTFDVSFKACAYRYSDIFPHPLGIVFSHNKKVSSVRRNSYLGFWLKTAVGSTLPTHVFQDQVMMPNSVNRGRVPSRTWFETSRSAALPDTVMEETFLQDNGYATTLLWFE